MLQITDNLRQFILAKVVEIIENSTFREDYIKQRAKAIIAHTLESAENSTSNFQFEGKLVLKSIVSGVNSTFIPFVKKDLKAKTICIDTENVSAIPAWLIENKEFCTLLNGIEHSLNTNEVRLNNDKTDLFSLAKKNEEVERLELQIKQLNSNIENVQLENDSKLNAIKQDYEDKLSKANDNLSVQLEQVKRKYGAIIQEINDRHKEEIEKLNTSLAKDFSSDKTIALQQERLQLIQEFSEKKDAYVAAATAQFKEEIAQVRAEYAQKETEIKELNIKILAFIEMEKEKNTLQYNYDKLKREHTQLNYDYAALSSTYEMEAEKGGNREFYQQKAISFLWLACLIALSIYSIYNSTMFLGGFVVTGLAIFLSAIIEIFVWTTNVARSSNRFNKAESNVIKVVAIALFSFRTIFNLIGGYYSEITQNAEKGNNLLTELGKAVHMENHTLMIIFSVIITLFFAVIEWFSIPLSLSHYRKIFIDNNVIIEENGENGY